MSRKQRITDVISQSFELLHLDVIDESHMHSVPKGAESHFKLIVVSSAFDGMNAVKRHQQIYTLLAQELDSGLHVLSLTLLTPQEWAARGESVTPSPTCRGGSKH